MRKQEQFMGLLGLGVMLALASPAAFATGSAPAGSPVVDPAAIAALEKMGATLRALPQFSLRSDASIELVLDDGQKIQLDQPIRYRVKQPDKLRIDLERADFDRQVMFDGSQMTIWAPGKKFYATAPIKAGSLAGLLANASDKFDIQLPLTDLFLWGTDAAPVSAITSALRVGSGTVDGDKVEQYALRQEGVDWQVWISSASSLPRRLVIVSRDDPALPEFRAELHWDTKSPIDGRVFSFVPPADASRIVIAPMGLTMIETEEK
ncbi:DUF2092 domain-containing protein [Pseudoxanthomonas suwonensis]|uniref:DUF2092 domain-containing protein n=1 Tax=Pseudoxanthomonas suwonensis TaxID=314722 RepID=UPI0006964824|nr:DUF2092 domain-containing protein [Pseudoxanthomonas suwonensis]